MKKKALASVALVPASVALVLTLAEGLYRVIRLPSLSPSTHPTYVQHDADLGWSHIPGAVSRHVTEEFDVPIKINNDGFRGPDWERKKPNAIRMLVLGDSETFGWGVEDKETFASVVDAGRRDWQVLNAAVSGYGTDQELLLMRQLLPVVEPDLVVCVFSHNDLFENTMSVTYGRSKPWFVLKDNGVALHGQPVRDPILDRVSLLTRAMKKNLWILRHRWMRRDDNREWDTAKALYRAMRDQLNGRPLLLVSDTDELERFSDLEKGILHVDTRPFLSKASAPLKFPIDGHLNVEGHKRMAYALQEGLRALFDEEVGED